jgi:hypothetical protein
MQLVHVVGSNTSVLQAPVSRRPTTCNLIHMRFLIQQCSVFKDVQRDRPNFIACSLVKQCSRTTSAETSMCTKDRCVTRYVQKRRCLGICGPISKRLPQCMCMCFFACPYASTSCTHHPPQLSSPSGPPCPPCNSTRSFSTHSFPEG